MLKEIELIKTEMKNIHEQMRSLNKDYETKSLKLQELQAECSHKETSLLSGGVLVCASCDKFLGHRI